MRAMQIAEYGSVSGGMIGAPSGSFLCEVGQTGMGDNGSYGGYSQGFDDGSSITFDGNGNVLGCTDPAGNWLTPDDIRNDTNFALGRMTNFEAEQFIETMDALMGLRFGGK